MASECAFDYVYLGKSGLKVSNMCLGTAIFGDPSDRGCSKDTSIKILEKFSSLGGNFIDTADVYNMHGRGDSERIIGEWLATKQRDDFVIGTKLFFPMDQKNVNSRGLSRKHIVKSIEESLDRLGTSYVDLYTMHCWDYGTPIEETLRTFNDLARQGKVLHIGASNFTGWQLQKVVDYCKYMGLEPVICTQMHYSLLTRQVEYEISDLCRQEEIALMPWSPLKGGWLSGKMQRNSDAAPSGSRIAWSQEDPARKQALSQPDWDTFASQESTWTLLDTIEAIAKEEGKTMAQVSLRWLLQKPSVASIVIGAKNEEQLTANVGASKGWCLSADQMNRLDDASALPEMYPYAMVNRLNQGRFRTEYK
ncbi:unnamed protein product [Owenia fusiformis]|nr:unnamed protein product [Owenia fusiformis]